MKRFQFVGAILTALLSQTMWAAGPIEVVLEPVHAMVVSAPVDGVLAEIAVEEGDAVAPDDLLIAFVRAEQELAIERAEEVLRKRQFDFAGVEQLFADNMTSETEKLEKEIEMRVAQIDLAQATEQLDRRLIRAVQGGTVSQSFHEPGEYVERGQPLLELVDQRELDARFYVPPEEGLSLSPGDPVLIRVPLLDATVKCAVVFVDPQVDPSSGLMRVRARLDNAAGRFKPGLRGWVSIGEEAPSAWP